jgi:hypothetical protein
MHDALLVYNVLTMRRRRTIRTARISSIVILRYRGVAIDQIPRVGELGARPGYRVVVFPLLVQLSLSFFFFFFCQEPKGK